MSEIKMVIIRSYCHYKENKKIKLLFANKFEKLKRMDKFLEEHNSAKVSQKKQKICIILYLLKKLNQ